ncbi:NUMOD4 motif-containing HNH endonuclease [Microbacterium sp. KR10-403]|uniref:NUMOD4 motif-containing HNH endonuclease n=1 Tax=Microbacterium sp. KR10-403 TaxID=3158581 RepID=UPI0032E3B543
MTETWRPIAERAGYEVSSLGRVRSVDRVIPHANGEGSRRQRGRILSPSPNGPYGYLSVMLGAGCRRYVHRLVAAAFLGDITGMDVDHDDTNPANNCVGNLTIMPHQDNLTAMSDRRTHCVNGHALTPENTVRRGRSRRACRTCIKQWVAAS